jgi:hypothetical protein
MLLGWKMLLRCKFRCCIQRGGGGVTNEDIVIFTCKVLIWFMPMLSYMWSFSTCMFVLSWPAVRREPQLMGLEIGGLWILASGWCVCVCCWGRVNVIEIGKYILMLMLWNVNDLQPCCLHWIFHSDKQCDACLLSFGFWEMYHLGFFRWVCNKKKDLEWHVD